MNAVTNPLNNVDIAPSDELNARRVLLIQQTIDDESSLSITNLEHLPSSDRLETMSAKLEALSTEQNFKSFNIGQNTDGLLSQINSVQANMLVLSLYQLTPSLIEQLSKLNQLAPIAVVVFARRHCPESAAKLVFAGIDSYKVGCSGPAFDTADLAVILDVAELHFGQLKALKNELGQTQKKLDDRKVIERAKGILMQHNKLSEETAYSKMRRSAMNQGRSMADLARRLIDIYESSC